MTESDTFTDPDDPEYELRIVHEVPLANGLRLVVAEEGRRFTTWLFRASTEPPERLVDTDSQFLDLESDLTFVLEQSLQLVEEFIDHSTWNGGQPNTEARSVIAELRPAIADLVREHEFLVGKDASSVYDSIAEILRDAGLSDDVDACHRWFGLESNEIFDAIDRGFVSARQYLRLRDHFDSIEEADEVPPRVLDLVVAGLSLDGAVEVNQILALCPSIVERWIRAGSNERLLLVWLRKAADLEWPNSEYQTRDAIRFASAGFTPKQAAIWTEHELSSFDAWYAKDFTRRSSKQLLGFLENGVTKREAHEWLRHDLGHRSAARWQAQGFTADEAGEWRQAGVRDPETASEWRQAFGPEDAAPWVKADISAAVAIRRRAQGWRPG